MIIISVCIGLSNDFHVSSAFEPIEKNKNFKIFLIRNIFNDFKEIKNSLNDNQHVPDVPKNKKLHSNATCDGCKNRIFGIRYVSRDIDNYDLCEYCFNKNNKSYLAMPSYYGFIICDDCQKEIKSGNHNRCITCQNTKVTKMNLLKKV